MNIRPLTATLFALIAGCGGGGEAASPSLPSAVATPQALPLVVMYGDSTQARDGIEGNAAVVAAPLLAGVAVVRAEGVGGSTARDLMNGTDGKHQHWALELERLPSSIVSFNYGINDHLYSIDQYKEYLRTLAKMAQARGRLVIFETPNPVIPDDAELVVAHVKAMREVATEVRATVCDYYALAYTEGWEAETTDGVHPNAVMRRHKGEHFAACVKQALGKQ